MSFCCRFETFIGYCSGVRFVVLGSWCCKIWLCDDGYYFG